MCWVTLSGELLSMLVDDVLSILLPVAQTRQWIHAHHMCNEHPTDRTHIHTSYYTNTNHHHRHRHIPVSRWNWFNVIYLNFSVIKFCRRGSAVSPYLGPMWSGSDFGWLQCVNCGSDWVWRGIPSVIGRTVRLAGMGHSNGLSPTDHVDGALHKLPIPVTLSRRFRIEEDRHFSSVR